MSPKTPTPSPDGSAEEAARLLEMYRGIVESAVEAVVTINEHHQVVYLNRAAELLFGYTRDEILGQDLAPLIPKKHRQSHHHYLERFLATRQKRLLGHVVRVKAENRKGETIPVAISFSLAQSRSGLLFTAIIRDLSAEQDLAQKVKASENLAAVGEMVATVSHEIRTPLTLIGGFATQLGKEAGLSPKGREKVAIITSEVFRLENILRELNDLARPHRYQWEQVDLFALATQVKQIMTPELNKGFFKLNIAVDPGLPPVGGDRNRLTQVLINLVNNAIQASLPGDEINIHLSDHEPSGILIQIKDRGQGIKPDYEAEVFTPFFTTKRHGTGLGLPLARRIVEEHGGTLSLESRPGSGTTALITLPRAVSSR